MKKFKLNIPLILGIIIVTGLIVLSIYPEYFTNSDPYGKERLDFVYINGDLNIFEPPIEPCKEYPWGTDLYGRDMKSLIIYGSKLTLFTAVIIALGRFVISLPIAILAGYGNRFFNWILKQFSILFSAFPLIIITMLLSRMALFMDIFKEPTPIVGCILIIFGWSRLANLLKEKVEEVLSQDFIEGEIAIGKNKIEIALQNVIPHLIPSIVVLFFLEIAQALLALSQISVFGLISSTGTVEAAGDYRIPFEVEWFSLLASPQLPLSFGQYWLVLYPAAAFAVSIIGFNLLGEGLRLEFDKRNSKIITWIKGTPSFISPLRLVYEIKNIGTYKDSVRRKLIFYAVILIIIFFPQKASEYRFNESNAMLTIEELSKVEYAGRRAGSGTNQRVAKYLADKLKEYGLQPFDGKFIHEFEMNEVVNVNSSTLTVSSEDKETVELEFRKDYYIVNPIDIDGTYDFQYVTMQEIGLNTYRWKDISHLKGKVIVIDIRGLDMQTAGQFIGYVARNLKPPALLYISNWKSTDFITKRTVDRVAPDDTETVNISVSSDKGEELIRMSKGKLHLNIECEYEDNPISNSVVGYIEGSNEQLKDEVIIIGSSFDSVGDDKNVRFPASMEAGGAAIELEIARVLANIPEKPERTVVFAFWDSTQTTKRGSELFLKKYFNGSRKAFYIDLRNFGFKDSERLIIDTTNTLPKDLLAQKYIKTLKKNVRRNDVKTVYGKIGSPITQDVLDCDINSIIIDSEGIDDIIRTPHDNLENINEEKLKGPGQMLLDTIYDIIYGGIR
jgi:peptide/nickel transport system permease protein